MQLKTQSISRNKHLELIHLFFQEMNVTYKPPLFPKPSEIKTPPNADGWKTFYNYYHVFHSVNQVEDDNRFWFLDNIHFPEPLTPFEAIVCEAQWLALSQFSNRVFSIPNIFGITQKMLNGYVYISPNPRIDSSKAIQRAVLFEERAGYYFDNWETLYSQWQQKVESQISALDRIVIPDLPEIEDLASVKSGKGIPASYCLLEAFEKVIENLFVMWSYQFEMLNLSYIALWTFLDFCKQAFPGSSEQTLLAMVEDTDGLLFRPEDELKKLATLAFDWNLSTYFKSFATPDRLFQNLDALPNGKKWLHHYKAAQHPWFNYSSGSGFYHRYRSWIDRPTIPLTLIAGYLENLENGLALEQQKTLSPAERDEMASQYEVRLSTREDRKAFRDLLGLSRLVFPYLENHNFFAEHWHHTIFWNKIREFGAVLKANGFMDDYNDVFFLNRHEIKSALTDLVTSWASGSKPVGAKVWPDQIRSRKHTMNSLRKWSPPPFLGRKPTAIDDPMITMYWGITESNLKGFHSPRQTTSDPITGCGASPGIAEGQVRILKSVDQLDQVEDGDILVCPITSPKWAPVFSKIGATVSDIGGIMCHAAIVSREFGLPAVVGTVQATRVLQTGQTVRVNGNTGVVSILT